MKIGKIIIIAFISLFIVFVLYMITGLLDSIFPQLSRIVKLIDTMAIIIGLMLMIILCFWGKIKINILGTDKLVSGILCSTPLILFTMYFCIQSMNWIFIEHTSLYTPKIRIAFIMNAINCLLVSITEELGYRVVMTKYLLKDMEKTKKNYVKVCIISSIIFGVNHIFVLFSPELLDYISILTIVLAVPLGFFLLVIYLKTKSYFLIVILHFGWNFTNFCDWEMAKNRYRYIEHYSFVYYQIPMLIVMSVVAIIILYKSSVDELELL